MCGWGATTDVVAGTSTPDGVDAVTLHLGQGETGYWGFTATVSGGAWSYWFDGVEGPHAAAGHDLRRRFDRRREVHLPLAEPDLPHRFRPWDALLSVAAFGSAAVRHETRWVLPSA